MSKPIRRVRMLTTLMAMVVIAVVVPPDSLAMFPVVSVQVGAPPGLPVSIEEASAQSNTVSKEITLRITVRSRSEEWIKQVQLNVLLLNEDGTVRAGGLVAGDLNLPPGRTVQRVLRLGNLLYVGHDETARMIVTPVGVQGNPTSWLVDYTIPELLDASRIEGGITFGSVRTVTASCGGVDLATFCRHCQQNASAAPASGIKSFACSASTCSCSYDFFPR